MDQKAQHACFEQWMDGYMPILYRVVNGFAEGTDRHDLMQEVLLALWKSIPSFRHGSQPSTFIYRVSHNAAMTWKRSQRNYFKYLSQAALFAPVETADPDRHVDGTRLEWLYSEIRKLPPLDRSLLLLFLDEVSYRDMAEIHGLSESNVGVRLNRLKQKLSQTLKLKGDL